MWREFIRRETWLGPVTVTSLAEVFRLQVGQIFHRKLTWRELILATLHFNFSYSVAWDVCCQIWLGCDQELVGSILAIAYICYMFFCSILFWANNCAKDLERALVATRVIKAAPPRTLSSSIKVGSRVVLDCFSLSSRLTNAIGAACGQPKYSIKLLKTHLGHLNVKLRVL